MEQAGEKAESTRRFLKRPFGWTTTGPWWSGTTPGLSPMENNSHSKAKWLEWRTRVLSSAWLRVPVQLFRIGVVLCLYSALTSDFEAIIVSLLLIIYIRLIAFSFESAIEARSGTLAAVHRHSEIRRLLGSRLGESQEASKIQKEIEELTLEPLIASIGNGAIGAIALWHIVKVAWNHF
jgi:hypothetical protein